MRAEGLEPPRAEAHQDLNLARLTKFRHARGVPILTSAPFARLTTDAHTLRGQACDSSLRAPQTHAHRGRPSPGNSTEHSSGLARREAPWATCNAVGLGATRHAVRHRPVAIEPEAYCYLLGLYLGDGCISASGRSHRLRITLDSRYPGIIQECVDAMDAIVRGRRPPIAHKRLDSQCVEVAANWRHWPCVFPQHGPGRKHLRPIVLNDDQRLLVDKHPKPLLRGLIHSDGTRIIAVERKGSYVRRAPRYGFSNLSVDILRIFESACEQVGIRYTRPSFKQIAIYRKASVALMDEFVGPKS
jgi:hypothetical protein